MPCRTTQPVPAVPPTIKTQARRAMPPGKVLDQLLGDTVKNVFDDFYFRRRPFAQPGTAIAYRHLFSWSTIIRTLESNHDDIWLAENGRLQSPPPENSQKNSKENKRRIEHFRRAFEQGSSVVIRHAERVISKIACLANEFEKIYGRAIDVQTYATPAGREGFGWHWDLEDVFVIQCEGEKEFSLVRNKITPSPATPRPRTTAEFASLTDGPELRCLLAPGDFLYIPAGYWHKARAIRDSFHVSVGVHWVKELQVGPVNRESDP